jgi:hypothetical protein
MVESPGGTAVYTLINDINFDQPHENSYAYEELTGDGSSDLIISRLT